MNYRSGGHSAPDLSTETLYGSGSGWECETAAEYAANKSAVRAEAEAFWQSHAQRFSFDGHVIEVAVSGRGMIAHDLPGVYGMEEPNANGRIRVKFATALLPEALFPAPITRELAATFTMEVEDIWFEWDSAQGAYVPVPAMWQRAWGKVLVRAQRRSTILLDGESYQFPISLISYQSGFYKAEADVNGTSFPVRYIAEAKGGHWELVK